MTKHKFSTGDRVVARPDAANGNVRPGVYTIVKVLPIAGQGCQYRARNALDTHERVLDEVLLRRADA
jgi:hypothetical protein